MQPLWYRLILLACGWLLACAPALAAPRPGPAIALHYGPDAPLNELRLFDIVVVEPDRGHDPLAQRQRGTELFAYASVAEVHPSRPYFKDLPPAWHLGRNAAWQSVVIDQSAPGWPAFFADQVIAPLWQKGYRGFFLDTLDSYRLAERFDEVAQQAGLVRVIQTLHARFPGIRLITNRGFEIAPRIKGLVEMVAAESLFRRWNASVNRYEEVPPADREWLLGQLRQLRDQQGIPGMVIDYVPPHDRALARETARRIEAEGFTPWVSDAQLHTVGVGRLEIVPRRVLVLYNGAESPALSYSIAHRFWSMPLHYMGYVIDYADVRDALPKGVYRDRYAGILASFNGFVPSTRARELAQWMLARKSEGMRMAIVGDLPFAPDKAWAESFGFQVATVNPSGAVQLGKTHPAMGMEIAPPNPDRNTTWLRLSGPQASSRQPWVEARDSKGQSLVAGALMPWGGVMLDPYTHIELPGTEQSRWVVNPFEFLRHALALSDTPIPDVTTENGRRLLLAHIDGDGFPSRAELPGSPFASQALLQEVLTRYRIPQTMSVIEGETAPHGLYPDLSPQLEDIARKMFRLPHVEIASHSFSHPFLWDQSVKHGVFADNHEADYHLEIPNYTPDMVRETQGSAEYIRQRLAPPDKPVKVFQWTGDTSPGIAALKATYDAGLLNLNGGDTFISKSNPSLTVVRPFGIRKGGYLQVYAPIANENIFTNLWRGPFYGYERVLETFEMTNTPRRIKPVGIYYHTYSASKQAGLKALHKVYGWALSQPLHPIFASEYIRKVQDFENFAIAVEGDGWRVRGDGPLRTLRLPFGTVATAAAVAASEGVAGWRAAAEGTYVHLASDRAWIARPGTERNAASPATPARVWLHEANARLVRWERDTAAGQTRFALQGHVPLQFSVTGWTAPCKASAGGQTLTPTAATDGATDIRIFKLADASANIQISCAAR